jgi:riboflavin biosynthesis pyrimidine reductase
MRQLIPEVRALRGREDIEAVYGLAPGRHLRVNFAASLDGVVELDGRSASLAGPADLDAFMAMRAVADAILVGAGTVRAERYGPVKLDEGARRRRLGRGQAELPRLAVVTGTGDLGPKSAALAEASRPLLVTSAAAARAHPEIHLVGEVVVCGESSVDPARALHELTSMGLGRVLCEGGPTLLGALLQAGVVDELCVTISPLLAGEGHRRLTSGTRLPEPVRFRILGLLEADGMLIASYARAEA